MVLLKASSMSPRSSLKKTRKQLQATPLSTPVKRPFTDKQRPTPTKASPSPLIPFGSPSARWLKTFKATELRKPQKPIGKAWPVNALKAYDFPDDLGWGRLCKHVLRSRGWTVAAPCRMPEEPRTDKAGNPVLDKKGHKEWRRCVFIREFEASVRGETPEELFGKRGCVQEGHHLKTIPQPKHALWLMNLTMYRVPGVNDGKEMNREDFAHIVRKYGHELSGELGNHRIAGIPGMDTAVSKDRLSLAMRDEPWFPMAYVLPKESKEFLARLKGSPSSEYWIAKPRNECSGAGISVYNAADPELAKLVRDATKRSVVQSYLAHPLLIGGYKFHMRIHLVVTNTNPLQAFVWKGGQCLFATKPYTLSKNTLGDQFDPPVHVTNQGLNATKKNKDNYCKVKPVIGAGQQISMRELEKHLAKTYRNFDLEAFWKQIVHISEKTVRYIGQASAIRQYGKLNPTQHFELMGLDLMVDNNLKIYMCEINTSPGVDYPDKKVLGTPNPDYDKERTMCTQTFHDLMTLFGMDADLEQNNGSLANWFELDCSSGEN